MRIKEKYYTCKKIIFVLALSFIFDFLSSAENSQFSINSCLGGRA